MLDLNQNDSDRLSQKEGEIGKEPFFTFKGFKICRLYRGLMQLSSVASACILIDFTSYCDYLLFSLTHKLILSFYNPFA